MNALVGQEAKANCSLFWLIRDEGADDGGRKDGGDFASTAAMQLVTPRAVAMAVRIEMAV